jgi:hypothetical protein
MAGLSERTEHRLQKCAATLPGYTDGNTLDTWARGYAVFTVGFEPESVKKYMGFQE